jgi:hypothetical protein
LNQLIYIENCLAQEVHRLTDTGGKKQLAHANQKIDRPMHRDPSQHAGLQRKKNPLHSKAKNQRIRGDKPIFAISCWLVHLVVVVYWYISIKRDPFPDCLYKYCFEVDIGYKY